MLTCFTLETLTKILDAADIGYKGINVIRDRNDIKETVEVCFISDSKYDLPSKSGCLYSAGNFYEFRKVEKVFELNNFLKNAIEHGYKLDGKVRLEFSKDPVVIYTPINIRRVSDDDDYLCKSEK